MKDIVLEDFNEAAVSYEGFGSNVNDQNYINNTKIWLSIVIGSFIGSLFSMNIYPNVPIFLYPMIMIITTIGLIVSALRILFQKHTYFIIARNGDGFYFQNGQMHWNFRDENGDLKEIPLYKNKFEVKKTQMRNNQERIYTLSGLPTQNFKHYIFHSYHSKKYCNKIYNINKVSVCIFIDTDIPEFDMKVSQTKFI